MKERERYRMEMIVMIVTMTLGVMRMGEFGRISKGFMRIKHMFKLLRCKWLEP